MLFVHPLLTLNARFQHSQLQNVRCPLVEHQLAGVDGLRDVVLSHLGLQIVLQLWNVQPEAVEHVDDGPVLHPEQSQQQVLWPNGA